MKQKNHFKLVSMEHFRFHFLYFHLLSTVDRWWLLCKSRCWIYGNTVWYKHRQHPHIQTYKWKIISFWFVAKIILRLFDCSFFLSVRFWNGVYIFLSLLTVFVSLYKYIQTLWLVVIWCFASRPPNSKTCHTYLF